MILGFAGKAIKQELIKEKLETKKKLQILCISPSLFFDYFFVKESGIECILLFLWTFLWINSIKVRIAIDIFCYKHLTNKDAQKLYRKELARALKPTGYYFVSLASENDGFYGPLLTNSPTPHHKLVIDPYAQIESYLYSISDLTKEFDDHFIVMEANEQESSSPMHGKEYTRKVLNLIMRKA